MLRAKKIKLRNKAFILGVILVVLLSVYLVQSQLISTERIYAGFRCNGEGSVTDWIDVAKQMVSAIPGTSPGGIWIIPESKVLDFDSSTDSALTALDNSGAKVLLQVGDAPYDSTVDQLIDATLEKYGNHSSVIGFGIDIELRSNQWDALKPVTDEEAQRWVNKIKQYNPNFKLFLKHWLPEVMPPTVQKDIIFIDDLQEFGGLNDMVNHFKDWSNRFSQADVGFQIGYPSDEWWWSQLTNPPKDIGLALLQSSKNCKLILWVNLSISQVFSPT